MIKWLAILLLTLMPLQATWAVTGEVCQHESGIAAKHIGHHNHDHKAGKNVDAAHDPVKSVGSDSDCAACHACCATIIPDAVVFSLEVPLVQGVAMIPAHLLSTPLDRPERPKWADLA